MPQPRRPRIAVIGTGGTIASIGAHPLELVEYIDRKQMYELPDLLARTPELEDIATIVPVPYSVLQSPAIAPRDWLALNERIHALVEEDPALDGVAITHGTATLEETAYFLNLTLKVEVPVVLVGAQRPASGLSADGPLNLVNAVRTAGSPAARGMGVLICLNDEIQAAREGTKTSTLRMQTFRSPDFGALGHTDADAVVFYRAPVRRRAPDTAFDVRGVTGLPRVDISMSYAGSDGAAIAAAAEAGAAGIVVAGFAPGLVTPGEFAAMSAARERGVVIVQGSRVGSGRVTTLRSAHVEGSISADNLTPQKARVLLMLALAKTRDLGEIQTLFDTH